MARKVFHSVPTDTGWKVKSDGRTISSHRTQRASEAAASPGERVTLRWDADAGLVLTQ